VHKKSKKTKWFLTTESVYVFGREERLQSAYEIALPVKKIELRGQDDKGFEVFKDRVICQSVK
jgi:hypothetical protein